jgi:hypothetical protein
MPSTVSPQDRDDYLVTLYFGGGDNYLRLCMDRAYGDFQRTLRGIGNLERAHQMRDSANAALIEMFAAIQATNAPTQQQFDVWHRGACDRLAAIYRQHGYESFCVGHAQKWLNMTFKYIYVMGERRTGRFRHLYDRCHVPLDNILINALKPHGFLPLGCAWSTLNDYQVYLERQCWIRRHFAIAPLDVEFLLWMDRQLPEGAVRDAAPQPQE